jgi:hypothetical protein
MTCRYALRRTATLKKRTKPPICVLKWRDRLLAVAAQIGQSAPAPADIPSRAASKYSAIRRA